MRCRLSPTADMPSHTSGAAMCQQATWRLHFSRQNRPQCSPSALFQLRSGRYSDLGRVRRMALKSSTPPAGDGVIGPSMEGGTTRAVKPWVTPG